MIPEFDTLLQKYADLIVHIGLNLQKGQKLVISGKNLFRGAPLASAPLAHTRPAGIRHPGRRRCLDLWRRPGPAQRPGPQAGGPGAAHHGNEYARADEPADEERVQLAIGLGAFCELGCQDLPQPAARPANGSAVAADLHTVPPGPTRPRGRLDEAY